MELDRSVRRFGTGKKQRAFRKIHLRQRYSIEFGYRLFRIVPARLLQFRLGNKPTTIQSENSIYFHLRPKDLN